VETRAVPRRGSTLEGRRPKRATCPARSKTLRRVADSRTEQTPEGEGCSGGFHNYAVVFALAQILGACDFAEPRW